MFTSIAAVRRSCLWTGAALLMLVSPAVGADAEGDEIRQSDLFETATVRAKPIDNATASVTVMDRQTIDSIDVATVGELLRFMPGVNISATGPRAGDGHGATTRWRSQLHLRAD